MAANPCAVCEGSKNAGIHSRHHPEHHPYQDARTPGLKPMAEGVRNFRRASGYDALKAAQRGAPCQIVSPKCTGWAEDLHEPMPRGRAGNLKRAVEIGGTIPACRACNGYVSGEGQVWAAERGFLFRNTVEGREAAAQAKQKRAEIGSSVNVPVDDQSNNRPTKRPATSRRGPRSLSKFD